MLNNHVKGGYKLQLLVLRLSLEELPNYTSTTIPLFYTPLSPSKGKMRLGIDLPTPSSIINFTIHLTSFMDFLKRYTIQT